MTGRAKSGSDLSDSARDLLAAEPPMRAGAWSDDPDERLWLASERAWEAAADAWEAAGWNPSDEHFDAMANVIARQMVYELRTERRLSSGSGEGQTQT